jgi:hypothetical protein
VTIYLVYSLCMLLVGALFFMALRRDHWRSFLAGAIIITPAATFSHYCIPAYWEPELTFHFITSPEDLIRALASATIVWTLAITLFRKRLTSPHPLRRTLLWIFIAYLIAGPAFLGLKRLFFGEPEQVMAVMFIQMAATGIGIAIFRPSLLPLAITGSIGGLIFHLIDMITVFAVAPEFRDAWNARGQLTYDVLGIPAWEIVWGAGFGFTWPLLVCLLTGIRLKPKKHPLASPEGA